MSQARSRLSRGAWIKITIFPHIHLMDSRRVSHEARGLKWRKQCRDRGGAKSRLSRGAWIKIALKCLSYFLTTVASLTRRVD